MLVGELRPQTIDIVATTLERELPEHVVEGAILEHQDNDVVDLPEVCHAGLSHHSLLRDALAGGLARLDQRPARQRRLR
jgi:hypothetical protein